MLGLFRKARETAVKFTDSKQYESDRYSPRRLDYILAGAGHLLVLIVGLITISSSAQTPVGGGDPIMVSMVTTAASEEVSQIEITSPAEIQEEVESVIPEEIEEIPEENPEEIEEIPEESPEEIPEENPEEIEEIPEEHPDVIPEENPVEETNPVNENFAAVSGEGSAGAGAPGPGTYESRVFNAVRRGYRTSVEPERSYRIILTVNTDGSTSVEVIRKSGTSAFDRAVENAIAMAQIPPMPPGRNSPAVINIEFLGPEQ
jgi:outer membrane biosynthesis protein TonB